MYHIEPIEPKSGVADFTIDLEVGSGIARNYANIVDLKHALKIKKPDGSITVKGAKNLMLPLDGFEVPTFDNACEIANDLALTLLKTGKAKPTDTVLVVLFDGLTAATAHKAPAWQQVFGYVNGTAAENWWEAESVLSTGRARFVN